MTEDATRGYLIVAVLFLAALTSVVSGTLLSPLLPAIAADLDVSVATAGQLGTVSAVVSVVVALAATPWMDRFPRSTWLRGQCLLLAAAAALCALAPNFAWLAARRMLAGLGGALVLTTCLAAAGDSFPDPARLNRAVGVIVSAAALGIVVGLPVLAQIEERAGWRWAIASLVLPLGLAFAATWLLPSGASDPAAAPSHDALDRYRRVLGDAPTRWLLATIGIFLLCYIGWLTYFGAYVVEELSAGAGTLGAIFLVAGTVQLVANNLAPAALARWPAARLFQLAVVIEAAALLLIATGIGGLWMVFVAVTGISVGAAVSYIVVNSLLLQASTVQRGSVMALSAASASLGSLLGITLGGAALAAFGYGAAYGLFGAMTLVALLTFALSAGRPVPGVTMATVET